MFVGDIGDGGQKLIWDVEPLAGASYEITRPTNSGDQLWLYWGVIFDEPIVSVTISAENPEDEGWWLDDVTVGVPEPTSFILLALGSLVLLSGRRAKHRVLSGQ